jgi:2-C-methyl-D-erythritol 4-phosphate cytidylyltransferase
MGGEIPKQYLDLLGRCVIDHTLERLLSHPLIEAVYVALSETDGYWQETQFATDPRVVRVAGGAERCHSVLNALQSLSNKANQDDWVLVHDAARPCLSGSDLDRLIDRLRDHPVGGLLAVPVQDTLKRVSIEAEVVATEPRDELWRAYTPQMFRLSMLRDALTRAIEKGEMVTDDASAMELAGFSPRIVEGDVGNLKITRPADLSLAAYYLSQASD